MALCALAKGLFIQHVPETVTAQRDEAVWSTNLLQITQTARLHVEAEERLMGSSAQQPYITARLMKMAFLLLPQPLSPSSIRKTLNDGSSIENNLKKNPQASSPTVQVCFRHSWFNPKRLRSSKQWHVMNSRVHACWKQTNKKPTASVTKTHFQPEPVESAREVPYRF